MSAKSNHALAVWEGAPPATDPLSYSQLSTFLVCEERWWQNYRNERKFSPNKYMFKGSLMHGLLENSYLKGRILTPPEMKEVYDALVVDPQYAGRNDIEFWDIYVACKDLYRWYNEYYPGDFEIDVYGVELHRKEGGFNGYADLIYRKPNGTLWLREHKARSDIGGHQSDLQSHIYSILFPEIEGIEYNLIKTYEYKNEPKDISVIFRRPMMFSTRLELEYVDGMIDRVRQLMGEIDAGRPRVCTYVHHICGRCDEKYRCPMYVGF